MHSTGIDFPGPYVNIVYVIITKIMKWIGACSLCLVSKGNQNTHQKNVQCREFLHFTGFFEYCACADILLTYCDDNNKNHMSFWFIQVQYQRETRILCYERSGVYRKFIEFTDICFCYLCSYFAVPRHNDDNENNPMSCWFIHLSVQSVLWSIFFHLFFY